MMGADVTPPLSNLTLRRVAAGSRGMWAWPRVSLIINADLAPAAFSLAARHPPFLHTDAQPGAYPRVSFSPVSAAASVTEAAASVTLTLQLDKPSPISMTVNYRLAFTGNTAEAGADFALPPGPVVFAPGEMSKVEGHRG